MKTRKAISLAAALTAAVSLAFAVPFSTAAEETTYTPGVTTANDGTQEENLLSQNRFSFDKYLVMDVNANVPAATFNFSIAKYDDTKAEGAILTGNSSTTTVTVFNGVTAQKDDDPDDETPAPALNFLANDIAKSGSNTAGVVAFTANDTVTNEGADGASDAVVWQDDATNEKYAVKTLRIDFDKVLFTEPGVYRYLIQETGTTPSVTNDIGVTTDTTYRTLDVYVEDYAGYLAAAEAASQGSTQDYTPANGNELIITGYVMYEGKYDEAPAAAGGTVGGKSTSYTNAYTTYELEFSKTVTGNQGSKDKYFAFDVTITGVPAGAEFPVSYTNADDEISAHPNNATTCITTDVEQPGTITADDNGISQTFYLQHGQSITIQNLPEGASYTVAELPEDYTPTAVVTGDEKTGDDATEGGTDITPAAADGKYGVSDTYLKADAAIDFTNDRNGLIPTGVLASVAAPAGVALIGFLGVAGGALYLKKKKSEKD